MKYIKKSIHALLLLGCLDLYGTQVNVTSSQPKSSCSQSFSRHNFLRKSIPLLCGLLASQSPLVHSSSDCTAVSSPACTDEKPSLQEPAALLQQFNEQIEHTKYVSLQHKQLLKNLAHENLEHINALQTINVVVKGDIFLVLHQASYVTDEYRKFYHRICDEEGNLIPLAKNDVLVSVWATSSKHDTSGSISWNWSDHGHPLLGKAPTFPDRLPLSVLDGKKEGDVISFFFKNEQNEVVHIELTCKQLSYRYSFDSFEKILMGTKRAFAEKPFVNALLVEDDFVAPYIQDGLLEKYTDAQGKVAFRHGPNGFKFND